jgi:crotonobetainyl-CoA:carnitine CoA-transferase CaiB-like acyl-CoA transferase
VRTSDGRIVFTVLDHQWAHFCEGLGLRSLPADPRFASSGGRQQNRDALGEALAPVFLAQTSAAWFVRLRELDILCSPINDYASLQKDAQVLNNGLLGTAGGVPVIRNPVRVGGEAEHRPPPARGEHTRSILGEDLKLQAAEVERLLALGAALC